MKTKQLALWMRLTLLVFLGIILSLIFLFYHINRQIIQNNRQRQETNLLEIGHFLARDQAIISALRTGKSTQEIQQLTHHAEKDFSLDFVVVMTMDKIRLTHPNPDKIYQPFQGGDEDITVNQGTETVSTATGTLGQSLRGFVPVFNEQKQEIGVISIGMTTTRISENVIQARRTLTVSLIISLLISLITAVFMAYTLKRQMHDLEPKEIGVLLEERNAMFENVHDGVIVTNQEDEVTLVNKAGQTILSKLARTESPYGQKIAALIPTIQTFQHEKQEVIDELYHQNGVDYLISLAPIIVRKRQVGKILMIRDMTELSSLHDQLINTTAYATSLQSQSHDFLNKLHVIYGLSDLGEYDQLTSYLKKILEPEQEFSSRMVYLIHNPLIAGFLIGERSRFVEKQLPFMVEIYPDIPAINDQSTVQIWISMSRIIHQSLLELQLVKELQIRLGYQNQQLETVYTVPISPTKSEELTAQLQTNYVNKLVTDASGRLVIENQGQWLKLTVVVPYLTTKEE